MSTEHRVQEYLYWRTTQEKCRIVVRSNSTKKEYKYSEYQVLSIVGLVGTCTLPIQVVLLASPHVLYTKLRTHSSIIHKDRASKMAEFDIISVRPVCL
jgi:hypothetical protein